MAEDRYKEAGVDIEEGNRFIRLIKPLVKETYTSGVITDIGGFSGLFSLHAENYSRPVLVASTDGVGTKLKIAQITGKHDTIGIDLVAMSVNDILVQGAKPLFFLDYLSTGKLDPELGAEIIRGIVQGCKIAGCSLIGGETAEMPGFYSEGEYDLAGFVVGLVDNDSIIDGSETRVGDVVVGIQSSGLHSNGFSLVRRIVFEEQRLSPAAHVEELGCTIGEELLRPTKIYAELISNLLRDFHIKGISHITGGGILENLPRVLPQQCRAVIRRNSWERPPVFDYLKKLGGLGEREMVRTFNNGLGLILVVPAEEAEDILNRAKALGEKAFIIGDIVDRGPDDSSVSLVD